MPQKRQDTEEHLMRYYQKEEEFLKEFEGAASKAAEAVVGEWIPDSSCDDAKKKQS